MKQVMTTMALWLLIIRPAHAGYWSVEGDLGVSFGRFSSVAYDDPIGSLFTLNATDGSKIIPRSLNTKALDGAAAFSINYFFDDNYFARATYRYWTRSVTANDIYFSNPPAFTQISRSFPQSLTATVHGIFLGAGIEREVSDGWLVNASLELGAGILRARGDRDIGTTLEQPFPSRSRVNLVYGAGVALIRRLNANLALKLALNWDHLGRADTGEAPDIGPGPSLVPNLPPVASMTAKLDVASMMMGLRYTFHPTAKQQ